MLKSLPYKPVGSVYMDPPPLKYLDFASIRAWRYRRRTDGKRDRLTDYFVHHGICLGCFGEGCDRDGHVCIACGGIVHPFRVLRPEDVFVIRSVMRDRYYCSGRCVSESPHVEFSEFLQPGERATDCDTCGREIDLRKPFDNRQS